MRFVGSEEIKGDQDATTAAALIDDVLAWCADRPTAIFFSPYVPLRGEWRNVLCWDKGGHVGIGGDRKTCWKRTFELIAVRNNLPLNGKRDSAVLQFPALSPPPSGHFCEKPLDLMRYLIDKLSQPGDTIIDPFMGSGTTIRAAADRGRKSIGIEIEEKWCEIAANRLAQGVLW
jgi:site-specific DNA-methyltransferase (adenine-specific)